METDEIKVISERMGEAVHNAWMKKRRKEKGWHSPEEHIEKMKAEGYTIDNIQKSIKICSICHPCMRPYSELPDGEKELDRLYPKLFFKILDEMGYQVVRKVK